MEANEQDREGLKILYEEISCGISCASLVEGYKIDQEREKKKTKKGFTKDPFKCGKGIFTERKSGALEYIK